MAIEKNILQIKTEDGKVIYRIEKGFNESKHLVVEYTKENETEIIISDKRILKLTKKHNLVMV